MITSVSDSTTLLEMILNAPVGSYADGLKRQAVVNKFVELHNGVARGGRMDVLTPGEGEAVDKMRAAKLAPAQALAQAPQKPAAKPVVAAKKL